MVNFHILPKSSNSALDLTDSVWNFKCYIWTKLTLKKCEQNWIKTFKTANEKATDTFNLKKLDFENCVALIIVLKYLYILNFTKIDQKVRSLCEFKIKVHIIILILFVILSRNSIFLFFTSLIWIVNLLTLSKFDRNPSSRFRDITMFLFASQVFPS